MPEERPEAEEEYIAEPLIKDMFRVLDKNRCGFLTCEEFKNLIGNMSEVSVSKEEMEEVIEDVDKNRDGKVTYDEFLCTLCKKTARNVEYRTDGVISIYKLPEY
ncbi:hypothetical protein LOTGIDRAFT_168372 [Lottia gigantea]|uniref:EF-hand domain-containing protein n=1 Tax=Lottia gigantea TaxID=225164 RepID=V3ZQU6_LOTGI|nr:hypothetical protein LOTGIDRAFT_168372 [Lottia gigantea]ESO84880.1 hypothetical protein LOTGIDRAFT_168372 [Lottia gigantea]